MNNNQNSLLTEEDLAGTVLGDLKRVVREYATAATESTCPTVRQMFTDLTNKTLTMQGELFTAMQQCNMYNTSSPAPQKEVTKQLNSYKSTQQQTQTWLQQANVTSQQANLANQQVNQQQTSQMPSSFH